MSAAGFRTEDSVDGKNTTVVVCCHPKAHEDSYIGPELTYARMLRVQSQIKGAPVRDNHSHGNVGTNISSFIDGERQLWTTMQVPKNSAVARAVRSGEYKAASLGLQHQVTMKPGSAPPSHSGPNWNDVQSIDDVVLEEISLCKRGKSRHTWIASYFSEHPNTISEDGRTARFYTPLMAAEISDEKEDKLAGENYLSGKSLCLFNQETPLDINHHHHKKLESKKNIAAVQEYNNDDNNMSSQTPQTNDAPTSQTPAAVSNQPRTSDGRYSNPEIVKGLASATPVGISASTLDSLKNAIPSKGVQAPVAMQETPLQAQFEKGQEKKEGITTTTTTTNTSTEAEKKEVDAADADAAGLPMSIRELEYQNKMLLANKELEKYMALTKTAEERAAKATASHKEITDILVAQYGESNMDVVKKHASQEQQKRMIETYKQAEVIQGFLPAWIECAGTATARRELENAQSTINKLLKHDPSITKDTKQLKEVQTLINVLGATAMNQTKQISTNTSQLSEIAQLKAQFAEQTRILEAERIRSSKLQQNLNLTRAGTNTVGSSIPTPTPAVPHTHRAYENASTSVIARLAGSYNTAAPTTSAPTSAQPPLPNSAAPTSSQQLPPSPATMSNRRTAGSSMPSFLRSLMAVDNGSRMISTFASANAGEPLDQQSFAIHTVASASYAAPKRSFDEMERDRQAYNGQITVKNTREVRPHLSEGLEPDWHKFSPPVHGFGLGKETIGRMKNPEYVPELNFYARAISAATGHLLNPDNRGGFAGTIPFNSRLLKGVKYHPVQWMADPKEQILF